MSRVVTFLDIKTGGNWHVAPRHLRVKVVVLTPTRDFTVKQIESSMQ